MSITGYDATVAAAHGFKIVTYADGSQESIPVSPAAKATVAKYGKAGTARIMPKGKGSGAVTNASVVYGNCGSSMLVIEDEGNYVFATTGYDVVAPVSNRIDWAVNFYAWSGFDQVSWPSGPSPAHWRGYGGVFTSTDGFGVAAGDVLLTTGAICGSGGPQYGW
jgi:hypothetical protein